MDADFLAGKTILCNVTLRQADLPTIKEGDAIVVLLSNGKKYLGTLGKFHFTITNEIASGNLEIQKSRK
jgi:hypothetical protein